MAEADAMNKEIQKPSERALLTLSSCYLVIYKTIEWDREVEFQ